MAYFSRYSQVLEWLTKRGLFHIDMQLNRMATVITNIPAPEKRPFSIQVLGTNGKGSTSTFLASLCREHGLSVGLYTSPHLVNVTERIQLNNSPITPAQLTHYANRIMEYGGESLTYFELLTAIAYLVFTQPPQEISPNNQAMDIAIYEAGLGGWHDATTTLPADLTLFTAIDYDHEQFLGSTLESITTDKAHAIRKNTPVLSVLQNPAVQAVLHQFAQANNTSVIVTEPFSTNFPLALLGKHQRVNAGLAIQAWNTMQSLCPAIQGKKIPTTLELQIKGLTKAFIAGRFQHIHAEKLPHKAALPHIIVDGAHNEHGLMALYENLQSFPSNTFASQQRDNTIMQCTPTCVIFSCMQDKDMLAIIPLLTNIANKAPVFIVPIENNERAFIPETLASHFPFSVHTFPSLQIALHEAFLLWNKKTEEQKALQPALLCGSLYLLGDFFTLYPEYLTVKTG